MIARLYVLVNVLTLALTFSYIYCVQKQTLLTHIYMTEQSTYTYVCTVYWKSLIMLCKCAFNTCLTLCHTV